MARGLKSVFRKKRDYETWTESSLSSGKNVYQEEVSDVQERI